MPKKKTTRLNKFNIVLEYKMSIEKSVVFLYTSNEQSEKKIKKIPFIIATKQ